MTSESGHSPTSESAGTVASGGSESERTVFHKLHEDLGGKLVTFAGWEMPIHYPTGIMAEHKHCRSSAAWFDVSHMAQLEIRGPDLARKLESLVPADLVGLPQGHCRYTFLTTNSGGILDDLIVTHAGDHFYVVGNASRRQEDIAHLKDHLDGVSITELTEQALVAVQGPHAVDVVGAFCPEAAEMSFMQSQFVHIDGVPCRLSRLGYTGEDGYELSLANDQADRIISSVLSHELCLPAGLGARDSLRLEAGLCLYGNDIDVNTSPVEASLSWAIPKRRREAGGFAGADIICKQLSDGADRFLVGIRPQSRVPARQGAPICDEAGSLIGEVTSGGFGPTVGAPVAMGYVKADHTEPGTKILLSIRGKSHPALVEKMPFVPQRYKR
ncbi:MAG: glycine cleavage system aminomethyltransferase GcvT [Granulosicoccus sp.]|nr:glycine cleavage system aminomethyltransferase GcvT [Granulosicoccus sp.]